MQYSREQYKQMYSQIRVSCLICSREIKKHNRINYRQYLKQKFCSQSCRSLWLAEYSKGENNPNYVDGSSTESEIIRGSPKYKRWRAEVFARDDYTCQICGERGGELNADHIKPFATNKELRTDINNGRTLCRECHVKTPTYGKKINKKKI